MDYLNILIYSISFVFGIRFQQTDCIVQLKIILKKKINFMFSYMKINKYICIKLSSCHI